MVTVLDHAAKCATELLRELTVISSTHVILLLKASFVVVEVFPRRLQKLACVAVLVTSLSINSCCTIVYESVRGLKYATRHTRALLRGPVQAIARIGEQDLLVAQIRKYSSLMNLLR